MTRKDVLRRLPTRSAIAAISAVFLAVPAAAQPAPAQPAPARPAPPAAQPAPPPGPGAAPPPDAPPAEQAPSAGTTPPPGTAPAEAAAAQATPVVAADPAPPAEDFVPAGEKDLTKARPVDAAKIEFKPGRGLSIKSADGDFELAMRYRAQFLYTILNDGAADTTTQGLEVRRMRFTLQGSAFGSHNRYYMELGFGGREIQPQNQPQSGSPLLDAYAEFDYLRDLTFRVGQYKPSFGRQRVMSEGNLQLVDVSEVTREFTFDRDQGFDFRSKDFLGLNMLKYVVGIYTGRGRNNFDFTEFNLLYLGRVEFAPLGLFEDYQESDHDRTKPRLSIGVGGGHFSGAPRDRGSVGALPTDNGTTDMNLFQADALFKVFGFSAQTEFFLRRGDRNPGVDDMGAPLPAVASRDGIGWYLQGGYLIPRVPFEVTARYGMIRGKSDAGRDAITDFNELGGGLGYYFARHPLKVQTDFFRLYESGNMSNGNNQFRLQLQVAL